MYSTSIEDRENLNFIAVCFKDSQVLSQDKQRELVKLAREGSETARDKLIKSNIRFVADIAKNYLRCGLSFQELISEGTFGLFEAINHYNLDKKNNFISYAVWWVRHYIVKAIQQNANTIRLPMNKVRDLIKIEKVRKEYQKHGCEGDEIKFISQALEVDEKYIKKLMIITKRKYSLDKNIESGTEENIMTLKDIVANEKAEKAEESYDKKIEKQQITYLLTKLNKREADILLERYGFRDGIGKHLGFLSDKHKITKERVRQIEKKAMEKLYAMSRSYDMVF